MKHPQIFVSICALFTLSCSAMDQAEKKIRPFSPQMKTAVAIAFPTPDHIIIGGDTGCESFYKHLPAKLVDPHKVFTIAANKKDLVVVTNAYGLFVYDPDKDVKIWENNTLPQKNICAIFGPEKNIIVLNTEKQSISLFDYEKDRQQTYDLPSYNPDVRSWTPTALLSCSSTGEYERVKITYLDDQQHTPISELSEPSIIKTYTPTEFESKSNTRKDVSGDSREALLSPNGQFIAIANSSTGCTIWNPITDISYDIDDIYKPDTKEGKLLIVSMAFHPNGCLALLNTYCLGCSLKYFNLATKKLIKDEELPFKPLGMKYIRRLDFSPDGTKIVTLGNGGFHILSVPDEVINQ